MYENLSVIFVCLVVGVVMGRIGLTKDGVERLPAALNYFVIRVSLPALIFSQVPSLAQMELGAKTMSFAIAMAWIQFGLALMTMRLLAPLFGTTSSKVFGAMVLTAGLSNSSFVGFPLLEALIGPKALPIALLVDQPGTFLVLSTAALYFSMAHSSDGVEGRATNWIQKLSESSARMFKFPPLISLLIAVGMVILIRNSSWNFPVLFFKTADRLATTLVPLALIAVGLQLRFSRSVLSRVWKPVAIILCFKLLLSPMIMLGLGRGIGVSDSLVMQVTVLEAAMAPMITSAVLVDEFEFDREVAALAIGLGIPLSLITVPLLNLLLFSI